MIIELVSIIWASRFINADWLPIVNRLKIHSLVPVAVVHYIRLIYCSMSIRRPANTSMINSFAMLRIRTWHGGAVLLGYRAAYAGDAVVYHKGSVASGGPNSDFVLYHGIRNSLFVLIKDVPLYFLLKNLGWIILLHSAIFLRYMIKGKLMIVLNLYKDFIMGISRMRKKRQLLHQKKLTKIKEINQLVSKNFYDHQYLKSALKELIPAHLRIYFSGGVKT